MSVLSILKMSNGGAEIYPFFTWKLFTRPSGGSGQETFYKIYAVKNGDTIRIANKDSKLFDGNDQFSVLKKAGKELEENKNIELNKRKLLTLMELTNPNYDHYYLFQESFDPTKLGTKDFKYSKKLLIRLK